MIIKASVICFVLILYMGFFYFRNKHLPLKSAKIFAKIYVTVLIFCIFDIITLYTVNHLDEVSKGVNLVVHIIYLFTIDTFLYLLFLYSRSYLDKIHGTRNRTRFFQALPYIVSMTLILILPLDYVIGQTTNYSMGSKVYALYSSVIFYNCLILYYSVRYWKELNKDNRRAIVAAVPIFIMVSVISILLPESLISIMGMTMITVGLMLSNENSEKYIDVQTGLFNQYAFEVVLRDLVLLDKEFKIAVIGFGNGDEITDSIDIKHYISVLKKVGKQNKKLWIYRISENGCAFIMTSREDAKQSIHHILKNLEVSDNHTISESHVIISAKKGTHVSAMMSEVVSFCIDEVNKMAYFDLLTGVRNRNAFEKELEKPDLKKDELYYCVIDLNNLKVTNDVLGHTAGDLLLQATAHLLVDVIGKDGKVYRQGGDEFAFLWNGNNIEQVLEKLEQERCKVNETRIIPIEYAIGYSLLSKENCIEQADAMMYENKRKMKQHGR